MRSVIHWTSKPEQRLRFSSCRRRRASEAEIEARLLVGCMLQGRGRDLERSSSSFTVSVSPPRTTAACRNNQ